MQSSPSMGWARCQPLPMAGTLFCGDPGWVTGSRVLSQSWGAVASLSLLHQPSRAAPGAVAMFPRGMSPPHRPRGMAMGGPASVPPGHVPQGTKPSPLVKLGCTARPPPQHPPYLQDVACCFPGNGNGIPHTSGRVSLHPLRCQPCFPGNPASRSSGRQVLGVPSCLLLCPATCHLTALLEGPCWGGARGGLGGWGQADKCQSCSF